MSDNDDWCTIESDPGVFTELLEELGCTQVQLEELWTLDDESLMALQESGDIYGLIFLFQWQPSEGQTVQAKPTALTDEQVPEGLFFAHQVTTNACATQAILSVVLNAPQGGGDGSGGDGSGGSGGDGSGEADSLELGPTLTEFRDFTASFPFSLKGVSIGASEPIKTAHNAFGRTDAFLNDGKYVSASRRGNTEDVFHFVAYLPKAGQVFELDGLQPGPIPIGTYDTSVHTNWLAVARTAIQERMAGDAIKFNLMAVMKDKRIGLRAQLVGEGAAAVAAAASSGADGAAYQLELEEAKRAQWKLENQRRRHNYVPMCVSLLKELARAGALPQLVEEAKERKRQKLMGRSAGGKK